MTLSMMLSYGILIISIDMVLGSVVVIVLEVVTVVRDTWYRLGVRGEVAMQW